MLRSNYLSGTRRLTFTDVEGNPFSVRLEIKDVLGEGTSSVCYAVHAELDQSGARKMILKEFQPICTSSEYALLKQAFLDAYQQQFRLANQVPTTMSITVKPFLRSFTEDGMCVLYDANYGHSLDRLQETDMVEQWEIIRKISLALQKLHSQNIVYMDLKPENVLLVDGHYIKFFDFDAAINLDHLQDVKYIRSAAGAYLAPELRLERDMHVIKEQYINPQIDIYALGVMFFESVFKRSPELDEVLSLSYLDELQQLFATTLRKQFTQKQQDAISKLLQRTVCLHNRWTDATHVTLLLEEILHTKGDELAPKEASGISDMIAAFILDEYPTYQFIREERPAIHLIGDYGALLPFLKFLLSACLLRKRSLIRIFTEDAIGFTDRLVRDYPLLLRTVKCFVVDADRSTKEITGAPIFAEPVAELYICRQNLSEAAKADSPNQADAPLLDANYFIFAVSRPDINYRLTERLIGHHGTAGAQQPVLAAYLSDRGDGYDLLHMQSPCPLLTLLPFAGDHTRSERELNFLTAIRRRAFNVHCYYSRLFAAKISYADIQHSFVTSAYNIESSLSNALSMRYKMHELNLDFTEAGLAEKFSRMIRSDLSEEKELLNDSLWLEHRRWNMFAVFQGYTVPSQQAFLAYAFQNGNFHINRAEKFHPLITDSRPNGMPLRQYGDWTPDLLQKNDVDLDELDRMSVFLHTIVCQRIAEHDTAHYFKRLMQSTDTPGDEETGLRDALTQYELLFDMALHSTGSDQWLQPEAELFAALQQKLYFNEQIKWLEEIHFVYRLIDLRNRKIDYKMMDYELVVKMPRIIKEEEDVIYVYTPIIEAAVFYSTLLLHPAKLVIVKDEVTDEDRIFTERWQNLIRDHRGLQTELVLVSAPDAPASFDSEVKRYHVIADASYVNPKESAECLKRYRDVSCLRFREQKLEILQDKSTRQDLSAFVREVSPTEQKQILTLNWVEVQVLQGFTELISKRRSKAMHVLLEEETLTALANGLSKKRLTTFGQLCSLIYGYNNTPVPAADFPRDEMPAVRIVSAPVLTRILRDINVLQLLRDLQNHSLIADYAYEAYYGAVEIVVATANAVFWQTWLDEMLLTITRFPYTADYILEEHQNQGVIEYRIFNKRRAQRIPLFYLLEKGMLLDEITDLQAGVCSGALQDKIRFELTEDFLELEFYSGALFDIYVNRLDISTLLVARELRKQLKNAEIILYPSLVRQSGGMSREIRDIASDVVVLQENQLFAVDVRTKSLVELLSL